MREPNKIPPFPAEGQGLKFPNLERNFLAIVIWIVAVGSSLAMLAYGVYKYEQKINRDQHKAERTAIEQGHAVETNAQEDFNRDARKLRDKLRREATEI